MKAIFLDFDGVVVLPDGQFCPNAVQLISQLCEQTGAGIVFSTSWKMAHTVPQLENFLRRHGLSQGIPIHGATPDLHKLAGAESGIIVAGTRGQEITAWLEQNPVESYVVIDDGIAQCYPHLGRCVETNVVFNESDFRVARMILERPIPLEHEIF